MSAISTNLYLYRDTRVLMCLVTMLLMLGLVEVLLEGAGWLGLVPGVNTNQKVPFGRVYWTAEGRGNSIRNRFGWHYPEFDVQASRRVAVIGDSFVEAI